MSLFGTFKPQEEQPAPPKDAEPERDGNDGNDSGKDEDVQEPYKLSDLMAARKVKALVDLRYRLEEDYHNLKEVRADVAEEIESLKEAAAEIGRAHV